LVISNDNSFRVLFDEIASVYIIIKIYLYFDIGNGQPREPALCHLYRHTFVPYLAASLCGAWRFVQSTRTELNWTELIKSTQLHCNMIQLLFTAFGIVSCGNLILQQWRPDLYSSEIHIFGMHARLYATLVNVYSHLNRSTCRESTMGKTSNSQSRRCRFLSLSDYANISLWRLRCGFMLPLLWQLVIRPHRMCSLRLCRRSVVCVSVCLRIGHIGEPYVNGWTDQRRNATIRSPVTFLGPLWFEMMSFKIANN